MSQYEHQVLAAPIGMAPAVHPARIPEAMCRVLRGFYPARRGKSESVRAVQIGQIDGLMCSGLYWYRHPTAPFLLSLSDVGSHSWTLTPSITKVDGEYVVKITATQPGVAMTNLAYDVTAPQCAVQLGDELVFPGDPWYRYYKTSAGVSHFYRCGIPAPTHPVFADGGGGTGGQSAGTYTYKIVYYDEQHRPSSPSVSHSVTYGSGHATSITLADTITSISGIAYWRIFRTVANGTTLYELGIGYGYEPITTTTVLDTQVDALLDTTTVCPVAGENDPPLEADSARVWRNRVVANETDYQSNVQISAADSPTQWNFANDGTMVDSGDERNIGTLNGDPVSGLWQYGNTMGVFSRETYHHMVGQDPSDWQVQPINNRGVASWATLAEIEGVLYFLGVDGVYAMFGNFTTQKISTEIDDEIRGLYDDFPDIAPSGMYAVMEEAIGWAFDGRYYLSIGTRTWAYDTITKGWCDTGLGCVRAAASFVHEGLSICVFSGGGDTYQLDPDSRLWAMCAGYDMVPSARPYSEATMQSVTGPTYVIESRDFDGAGVPLDRLKHAYRYTAWGNFPRGVTGQVGVLHLTGDNGYAETYPIDTRFPMEGGMIVQQQAAMLTARELRARLEFTVPGMVVKEQRFEYWPLA